MMRITLLRRLHLESEHYIRREQDLDETGGVWPGKLVISDTCIFVHDTERWWRVPLPLEGTQAAAEVLVERARQDQQWGGPDKDDKNTPLEWTGLITQHVGRALWAWNSMRGAAKEIIPGDFTAQASMVGRSNTWTAYTEARRHLINVAALAIAAIEALDRAKGKIDAE